jgi:hypothetical protein
VGKSRVMSVFVVSAKRNLILAGAFSSLIRPGAASGWEYNGLVRSIINANPIKGLIGRVLLNKEIVVIFVLQCGKFLSKSGSLLSSVKRVLT